MKTSENGKYLKPSKSMFFVSLIISFLPGYVSASGTIRRSFGCVFFCIFAAHILFWTQKTYRSKILKIFILVSPDLPL